jgi:hypothetical protein
LAQRSDSCVRIDGRSGYVGEERMKDHVVFAIEEKNLALGGTLFGAKSFCELYSGKSPTDYDYSYCAHLLTPLAEHR